LKRLEELASELGFEIDRQPFLLRRDSVEDSPAPSNQEDGSSKSRRWPLYLPGHGQGTEPASNRSVTTLAVHAATAYAKDRGLDGPFYWAASKEYWEQGTDLGNLYTLRRLSIATGLDWDELWPDLESGRYHNMVLAQHEKALKAGVTRTPSFQIGGRLHSGPIGAEELQAAIAESGTRA
jgi:predicted DsbA family dithiol-disulfide isomerase